MDAFANRNESKYRLVERNVFMKKEMTIISTLITVLIVILGLVLSFLECKSGGTVLFLSSVPMGWMAFSIRSFIIERRKLTEMKQEMT